MSAGPCGNALALAMEMNGRECRASSSAVASTALALRPKYRRQNHKMKLAIARTLPQELRFDLRDQRPSTGQQIARRRFPVAQQHVCRLDLGTLPEAVSTCNDASLSVRTVAVLKAPSSSNRTYIGGIITGKIQRVAATNRESA